MFVLREKHFEELAEQLAVAEGETRNQVDAALQTLQIDLQCLVEQLRTPQSVDPFVREPQCDEAVKQVLSATREIGLQEPAPLPLQQIGQYELLSLLGQGGMGAVYKARHRKLDKIVALKVLPAGKLADQQAVIRFEREMRAVGKLQHPNIVAAHDAGEIDGTHYLVMELVDGIDLGALSRTCGLLPINDACELVRQAALGLQHAYEHGLVHRDIKPSNLMLARQQRGIAATVKILDMGLALLEEAAVEDGKELTSTGQVMGTIDYMAPEQSLDTHQVDIRADIYSLGATLFRLLTGRAPFADGTRTSITKKLMTLANTPAPDIRTLRPDCPSEVAQLVAALLAKDPAQRPTPPSELARLLAPFAQGADLQALFNSEQVDRSAPTSLTITKRTVEANSPTVILSTDLPQGIQPPHNGKSRRRLAWAGGAGAAALLGLMIITINHDNGTKTRIETSGPSRSEIETPESVPEESASSIEDPERAAAEWVLSIGGKLHLIPVGKPEIEVTQAPLPRGAFTINRIDLAWNSRVNDQNLARLKSLKSLSLLNLESNPQLTDAAIAQLSPASNIYHMNLTNTGITDACWAQFARLTSLRSVAVSLCRELTGTGISHLQALPELTDLLIGETRIGDSAFLELTSLPKLRNLQMFGDIEGRQRPLTPAGLSQLARVAPGLESVELPRNALIENAAGLLALRDFPKLKCLGWRGTRFTPDVLNAMKDLKSLEQLNIVNDLPPLDAPLDQLTQVRHLAWASLNSIDASRPPPIPAFRHPGIQKVTVYRAELHGGVTAFLRTCPNAVEVEFGELRAFANEDVDTLAGLNSLKTLTLQSQSEAVLPHLDRLTTLRPDIKLAGPGVPTELLAKQAGVTTTENVSASSNPARAAAEWVISVGGAVSVHSGDQYFKEITRLADLPSAPMTIDAVLLSGRQNLSVPGMSLVARVGSMRELRLSDARLDDDLLAALAPLSQIDVLWFDGSTISDAGFKRFAANTKAVRHLYLGSTKISAAALAKAASQFPDLQDLECPAWTSASDDAGAVCTFHQLTELNLPTELLTEKLIDRWRNDLPRLNGLGLSGEIRAAQIAALDRLASLRELWIGRNCTLQPGALRAIGRVPALEKLVLRRHVPADLWGEVQGLRQLKALWFFYSDLPQSQLDGLATLPNLNELQFIGSPIDAAAVSRLQTLRPDLKILDNGVMLPRVEDVARVAAEWVFSVGGKVQISVGGTVSPSLTKLSDLPAGPFEFDAVNFSDCHGMTPAGMTQLAQVKSIRDLWLNDCDLTDDGLAALSSLTNLSVLRLNRTKISDNGLHRFAANVKELTNLEIRNTLITCRGLSEVAPNLPKLTSLHCQGIQGISAEAAPEGLGRFPNLQSVDLDAQLLQKPFVEKLFATVPRLVSLGISGRVQTQHMQALGSVGQLREVWFQEDSEMTPGALAMLSEFRSLASIGLKRKLSTAEWADLTSNTAIPKIWFYYAQGPQPRLEDLAKIPGLRKVHFTGTPTDEAALDQLQTRRPDLEVVIDGQYR
ncbi:serine/threonine-protein kinase [Planctomicrobium piriforme]|uniref:Serine/threonine protein kinase n=1 Tax=Planctomicrobium piriforme TaxID=1576369 RepID=A0A1I3B4Y5_9PLAN|nr:serine/threonine-protein kinase [Planctomicrobium piriforme]SFH57344.1 Serine/threonine protein kinase [Planctomicrobium piriforme]